MREQILIGTIAMVGIAGLLSIHRDVKLTKKSHDLRYQSYAQVSTPQILPVTNSFEPTMVIDHHSNEPSVVVTIPNFNTQDQFVLDFGNGERKSLLRAEQEIFYHHSGNYLLKLFKNEELVEASELLIADP